VISYQLSIPIVQLSYTIYNNVIQKCFELEHKSVCYYIPSFKVVPIEIDSIVLSIFLFQIKLYFIFMLFYLVFAVSVENSSLNSAVFYDKCSHYYFYYWLAAFYLVTLMKPNAV
jgi:hypothetical protein